MNPVYDISPDGRDVTFRNKKEERKFKALSRRFFRTPEGRIWVESHLKRHEAARSEGYKDGYEKGLAEGKRLGRNEASKEHKQHYVDALNANTQAMVTQKSLIEALLRSCV